MAHDATPPNRTPRASAGRRAWRPPTRALPRLAPKQGAPGCHVVDVREPTEFLEGHYPGAVNLPASRFRVRDYERLRDRPICLLCSTGARARDVARKLDLYGYADVSVARRHMDARDADAPLRHARWTVDRQFRLALGVLLTLGLTAYAAGYPGALAVPAVVAAGLTITALLDRCYFRALIARMPWNAVAA